MKNEQNKSKNELELEIQKYYSICNHLEGELKGLRWELENKTARLHLTPKQDITRLNSWEEKQFLLASEIEEINSRIQLKIKKSQE